MGFGLKFKITFIIGICECCPLTRKRILIQIQDLNRKFWKELWSRNFGSKLNILSTKTAERS